MRPLPTSPSDSPDSRPPEPAPGDSAHTLDLNPAPKTAANQRRNRCTLQRAYPWALLASTAMAGVFCFLYLTKPVIEIGTAEPTVAAAESGKIEKPEPPAAEPESKAPETVEPRDLRTAGTEAFEDTNLRIQHVLGATGPDGEDLGRITLNVPVLYESAQIRWTRDDLATARSLLARISRHQQKSRRLREEAVDLVSEWDALMIRSVPDSALRADSPTLPENQGIGSASAAALSSTEAIEIDAR
jgi:hypothetical protein